MECMVKDSDERKVLVLEGDLTIINAAELKRILLEAIDNSTHVELDLEHVTDIDLSCIQLFCSAHRTSLDLNRTVSIGSGHPEVIREAVKEAGFPLNKGCKLDADGSCLWIERP
jgi:anti-anti-sigma regulatory factor